MDAIRDLPSTILLDLDDTLLRYSAVADGCWREVCEAHAPDLGGIDVAALCGAILEQSRWFWSDPGRHRIGRLDMRSARRGIVRDSFRKVGLPESPAGLRLADAFTDLREERVELFAGAIEALHAFRDRGIRLGLVTNGHASFQRRKVERFGLTALFEVILIESELGFGKPDSRVFEHALAALRAQPRDAWMVGDSLLWDVAPAQRLGIHDVWVDHARTGLPAASAVRPTRVVGSVAELAGGLR